MVDKSFGGESSLVGEKLYAKRVLRESEGEAREMLSLCVARRSLSFLLRNDAI